MKLHNLHSFTSEDWKKLEVQFAGFSLPTVEFVTENKGTLAEAESIYADAFVYYTQLIELKGPKMMDMAEQIIYSFARKLWIQKLDKRNVDTDFVSHRRAFFEMEDAFHEIDSINKRSEKTAEKLAHIGEPARTLIIEHIGRKKELMDVARRLNFEDEERAFGRIAKSLRRLIKDSDAKDFDVSDTEFEKLVRFVLDNNTGESVELSEDKKVGVTLISRSIAMVRSYVNRKNRLQRLKEMQERIEPDTQSVLEKKSTPVKNEEKKMKPLAVLALAATVALTVSVITAFGLSGITQNTDLPKKADNIPVDTIKPVEPVPVVEEIPEIKATAFAITSDGYFLTTASVVKNNSVRLSAEGVNFNADVVFKDTLKGIALLKGTLGQIEHLPYRFSPEDGKVGQELFSVGYPEDTFFYTKGILNAVSKNGLAQTDMIHSAPGSPVLSEHGQILGLIIDNPTGENLTSMIPVSKLKSIIENWEKKTDNKLKLTARNGLYYSDRTAQIEKLSTFVYKVEKR